MKETFLWSCIDAGACNEFVIRTMKSKVAVVKCKDYETRNVELAVKCAFELLGGTKAFIKSNEKVLLKPNLLGPYAPERCITTHPEVVRSLIKIVKEANALPYVGDSNSSSLNTRMHDTLQATGISRICEEETCEIVSFERAGVEEIESSNPNNRRIPSLEITKAVFDLDALISVAKMKTHVQTVVSGAIKNLYGCVPGFRKTRYHYLATRPDDFAEVLADVLAITKPRLGIIDGIYAMEGMGPADGKRKHVGVLLMSEDLVALDTVMTTMMKYDSRKDPIIQAAVRCGLGVGNLDSIQVVGERLESVMPSSYALPSNLRERLKPRWLGPVQDRLLRLKPRVLKEKCVSCCDCSKLCPAKAISVIETNMTVDKSKCVGCMCCYELCANRAIVVDYSIAAKIYFNKGKIISLPRNVIKYTIRFLKSIIHPHNHIR